MGLPVAALAAATAVQTIGSIEQGKAQAAAAKYNAQIATQNSAWSAAEGEQNAGVAGLKTQEQSGKIKVAQAANNIDVNSGSAVAVQKSQAEMGMLNEMNIRSNAARQAYGYQAQSGLDKSEAKNDETAGYIGAAGSLLGGASKASMYSNWMGSQGLGSGGSSPVYED